MKVGFLTAGGIAPCLSASIGSLIYEYNKLEPNATLIGYMNGYQGLLLGNSIVFDDNVKKNYEILFDYGGSPIGNSRVKLTNLEDCIRRGYVNEGQNPLEVAAKQLKKDGINILHMLAISSQRGKNRPIWV